MDELELPPAYSHTMYMYTYIACVPSILLYGLLLVLVEPVGESTSAIDWLLAHHTCYSTAAVSFHHVSHIGLFTISSFV